MMMVPMMVPSQDALYHQGLHPAPSAVAAHPYHHAAPLAAASCSYYSSTMVEEPSAAYHPHHPTVIHGTHSHGSAFPPSLQHHQHQQLLPGAMQHPQNTSQHPSLLPGELNKGVGGNNEGLHQETAQGETREQVQSQAPPQSSSPMTAAVGGAGAGYQPQGDNTMTTINPHLSPPPQQPPHVGVMMVPAPTTMMAMYPPQITQSRIPMSTMYGYNHPLSLNPNVSQPPPTNVAGHPLTHYNEHHRPNVNAVYYQPVGLQETSSTGTTIVSANSHHQIHGFAVDQNTNNSMSHGNSGHANATIATVQQQQLQHIDGGGGGNNDQPMLLSSDKRSTPATSTSQAGGGNLAHCA